MKVTNENIKDINFFAGVNNTLEHCQRLLEGLLVDLTTLNGLLIDKHEEYRILYIDYINEHTEYSPERIDPCPDYYGMFRLRFENNSLNTIGGEMNIDQLDLVLFVLNEFEENR